MTVFQFLLAMNLGRIALMASSILWLIFTDAPRELVRRVLLVICLIMLSSNLIAAVVSVGILHVKLW